MKKRKNCWLSNAQQKKSEELQQQQYEKLQGEDDVVKKIRKEFELFHQVLNEYNHDEYE